MEPGNPDLVFEVLDETRLIVSCQGRFNPSDDEWDRWLAAATSLERRVGAFRLLVATEGGHPTKSQLDRLRATKKSDPPTVVVSASLALRFVGSALTFVNPTIRFFAPADLDAAFDHLELMPADRESTRLTMERLKLQLGVYSRTG
jgi:hypothetical protein